MASVQLKIETNAQPGEVWAAIEDFGALHTRLVPGFVVDTRLEPGVRVVTFANGRVMREPIVTVDRVSMRLVWTSQGGRATHYNAALQVHRSAEATSVVWTADFLPDAIEGDIAAAMEAGMAAMKRTLDRLAA
jgi:hypothetical protein